MLTLVACSRAPLDLSQFKARCPNLKRSLLALLLLTVTFLEHKLWKKLILLIPNLVFAKNLWFQWSDALLNFLEDMLWHHSPNSLYRTIQILVLLTVDIGLKWVFLVEVVVNRGHFISWVWLRLSFEVVNLWQLTVLYRDMRQILVLK